MDKLVIKDIKLKTLIGIHPWEQQCPQTLHCDLVFQTDTAFISKTDNIKDAIDYVKVIEHLSRYTQENHFKLIETLAHHLAEQCLNHFPTSWVQVTLRKPSALINAQEVAISIERSKST